MKNIDFKKVQLNSGFLYEKQKLNEDVTINAVYDRFYETGRFDALNCNWKEGMDKKPHIFWDSDIAKWVEGASYIISKNSNPDLENKIEKIIDAIEENQWEDGYFNSYYTVCEPDNRFNVRNNHELYCAGHLFEAACAYYEATGKDRFLKLMEGYADFIKKVFIDEKSAGFTAPGHEEIELALLKMYKTTKNEKYLNMAKFFIDNRGVSDEPIQDWTKLEYDQSHMPPREQRIAVGHSVRAGYLYTAMAEFAEKTKDKELEEAAKALFSDIVNKQMYITGALGATREGEAFTQSYDLKNDKAYAETCASIAMMYFADRMQGLDNNSIYADIIEREIYNGMISGLSLDGKAFFYENPLEINLRNYTRFSSTNTRERYAITQRKEVFDCSCCPPNLNRVLSSIGGYVYGVDKDAVYVNQFAGCQAEFSGMKIEQKTDYPKSGNITFNTENVKKLCIRIPSWCKKYSINKEFYVENGYAVIENPGSDVNVNFVMEPVLIQSNTEVYENAGKAAVQYGPFVYAAESVDNIENLHSLFIDKNVEYEREYSENFKGYILKLKGYKKITPESLYSEYSENFENFKITLIPFACFANRGESNMCVWLNVK